MEPLATNRILVSASQSAFPSVHSCPVSPWRICNCDPGDCADTPIEQSCSPPTFIESNTTPSPD
jgi:hypothetical protein